jgi:hypothetical protein
VSGKVGIDQRVFKTWGYRDLNTTMIYLEHEDGALNQILDDVFREL